MAVTLSTRAGSTLRTSFVYWTDPSKTEPMPSGGYTARLQLRSANGTQRVLLSTTAVSGVPNAPLILVDESHWTMNLLGSVTRMLPPVTRFEVELINDDDPDDVVSLASGVINVTPQGVSNE